jgi:L-asparaginase II
VSASVPLLRLYREGRLESQHRGLLCVVEDGEVVLQRGDPTWHVFYRSTSKPLQAVAGVASGAADAFGLTEEELAVATGSHNGGPEHVRAVRSILKKAQVPEEALGCGGHYSFDPDIAYSQRTRSTTPKAIWSNCSGKHALMLATARHLGAPLETYLTPTHPVQEAIRRTVALFCGLAPEALHVAVDGCSAPTFAVPLERVAWSMAHFGAPADLPDAEAHAARRLAAAMHAHPILVAGRKRFDTDLMQTASRFLLAKAGAEAVHVVVVPERRLGMAVKVEDGNDRGYRLVVLDVLRRLGVLEPAEADALEARQAERTVRNWRKSAVGHVEVLLD